MNPFRSFILTIILCLLAAPSFATTFLVPSDAELARNAEVIAVVRVESAESRWDHGRLMTAYTLRVDDAIKGDLATGDAVEVWQLGGLVDGVGFYVPGSADYRVGEKALAFLGRSAYGRWATYGMMLGRFAFAIDGSGNKLLVRDREQELCGIDANGTPHREALRSEKAFLDFVRGIVRGGSPTADYTVEAAASKTADSVLQPTAVPTDYVVKQGGAAGTLPMRWRVFDTAGSEGFAISGTQTGTANSNTSAQRAVQAWTNNSNSNVSLNVGASGCSPSPCSASQILASPDGINDILFDAQSSDMPPGSEASGIGWGGFWYSDTGGGATHSFASATWYAITEGEIFIRTGSYSQAFLDQLVTHEVGHTIGFRHSDQAAPASSQAIMNSSINGSYGNTLQSWDKDAVEYVYGPGPCRPTITSQPPASVIITAGQTTTLTVSATGTGLSYQWYAGSSGDTSSSITGATAASYTTPPLTSTTKYWVRVGNSCGTVDSSTATVNVQAACSNIGITVQPQSQTITNGQTVTLSVSVNGTNPTYQWYTGFSGDTANPIPGAGSATYTTPALSVSTRYWVRIKNACSSRDSNDALITVVTTCVPPAFTTQPANATILPGTNTTLSVAASGTGLHYQWYQGAASDTTKPIANTDSATYTTPILTATAKYWVRISNACGVKDSQTATVNVGTACQAPVIVGQPAGTTIGIGESATLSVNATGPAPLSYQWYRGTAPSASNPVGTNSATLKTGAVSSTTPFWVKVTSGCGASTNSSSATVTVQCRSPLAPVASIVTRTQSNVTYTLQWTQPGGSSNFDVDESRSASFATLESTTSVKGLSKSFSHPNTTAAAVQYFYRVRAVKDCDNSRGAYATTVAITIDPLTQQPPSPFGFDGTLPFPAGPGSTYKYLMLIKPPAAKTALDTTFSVSTTAPFLTVSPSSGTLPPAGTTITVTATATGLPLGSNTGTVNVTTPGGSLASVPVSVSLVTPVQPTPKDAPPDNALIIPAIAHVDTPTTQFVSDVRIANVASQVVNYQVTFTQSGLNGMAAGKQTTFSIPSNQTVALNDLVQQWFGEGANSGALEIRPLSTNVPQLNLATVATSRTYAKGGGGTFGQFIPAVPFSEFVGKGRTLSIQHIAQSTLYRTNFGIVEGSGQPAEVKIAIFDTTGKKVDEFALAPLLPGEFRAINRILETRNVALADGRLEVSVTSDTGRITAYASVLDNRTEDPFLVTPVETAKVSANRYVAAGVADLRTGGLSWRTDMRVFNAGSGAVNATMTFYPDNAPNAPISKPLPLKIGEVRVLDNLLATYFGVTSDMKGVVQVTTPSPTSLVVTTRTYDQRTTGTYGQFIPAVTVAEGIGKGDRPMQLLQLEQSSRYRTNLGITELSGNKVFGEIVAVIPGETSAAVIPFSLEPNQTQQYSKILNQFLGKDVYNARISVKVTDGSGKIAAYASVVDAKTSDPTYVPAQ